MKWVALSAFVGSFFPAYLFAFAETEISSSITAVMVSLTPLFTLLISVFVFGEELLKKTSIRGLNRFYRNNSID
jgi:drug/metabolite transporter (DMT)-like permease